MGKLNKNIFKYPFFHASRMRNLCFSIVVGILVFIRMVYADAIFSLDYLPYLKIINSIKELSYYEILFETLDFPYNYSYGIVPIEFGTSLIIKTISLIAHDPVMILAIIAATSVGLRVFVMRSIGVPFIWIILINLYSITMFEANALRLGLASGFILFGIYRIYLDKNISGYIFITLSLAIHLQSILFIFPFVLFALAFRKFGKSVYTIYGALVASGSFTILAMQYLPVLGNEKIQEYIDRGESTSSGFTITSILALAFVIFLTFEIIKNKNNDDVLFPAIFGALFVSVVMLIYLTNVAVIGDRAWQLGYVISATFVFSNWSNFDSKKIPISILLLLSIVMASNVLIRYPLSNFFSPPFPQIYL